MSRCVCQGCGFPSRVCLCEFITRVPADTRVWVLQHPSEVSHGKNSARLLPLLLPRSEIFVGETEADFAALRERLLGEELSALLVYPSEGDTPNQPKDDTRPKVLLLLDGTWRKALKMYHLNPWLHRLPHVALTPSTPSAYLIRKAARSDSLSTLEAAAEALTLVEPGLDVSPLRRAFAAMVSKRLEAMPEAVQQRYQQGANGRR